MGYSELFYLPSLKSINGTYSQAGMNHFTFDRMTTKSTTAKLLLYIMANPYCTRREVQDHTYGFRKFMYSSYMGATWRFFLAHDLICKHRDGKTFRYNITSVGMKAVHKILINTAKKEFTF